MSSNQPLIMPTLRVYTSPSGAVLRANPGPTFRAPLEMLKAGTKEAQAWSVANETHAQMAAEQAAIDSAAAKAADVKKQQEMSRERIRAKTGTTVAKATTATKAARRPFFSLPLRLGVVCALGYYVYTEQNLGQVGAKDTRNKHAVPLPQMKTVNLVDHLSSKYSFLKHKWNNLVYTTCETIIDREGGTGMDGIKAPPLPDLSGLMAGSSDKK
eukprot:Clim_evm55s150 gene=Clim_evmTU55s150